MLNKVSVLDILASIIRKTKVIICLMAIFAVAFGFFRFYRNGSAAAAASQELSVLESEVKAADTAYTNLSDRIKILPVTEITAKTTWVASAVYRLTPVDNEDDTFSQEFFRIMKLKWETSDLSKVTADLFNKAADDEGVRDTVDLSIENDRSAVLTVKGRNKAQCIALYYMLNELVMGFADEELAEVSDEFAFVQTDLVVKKTNDSAITQKQEEYKEALLQLETEKNAKHDEYDRAVIDADRFRGVRKWATAGALMILFISVAWAVCRACMNEPALSAAHVNRETGLDYLGIFRGKVSFLDRIASRISGERIKDSETEKEKLVNLIKLKKELVFSAADDCSKSKDMQALPSRLNECGLNSETKTEDTIIKEKVKDRPAVIVIKKDKTTIREVKQLNTYTENSGYDVIGFVFI